MSKQQDGIGWVPKTMIYSGDRPMPDREIEVAYGPELAALRLDRERLEAWMETNRRHNELVNTVFGDDVYALPTTRDEFDAYMQRLDAAMEETR